MLSEILNSINVSKKNLMESGELEEKDYLPFVINKCLSYFPDTIFYANQMNRYPLLDKKIQYDYYLNGIIKRKRFSKWIKPEENADIEIIKEIYGYSDQKAREVIDLLPMDKLRSMANKGGQKR